MKRAERQKNREEQKHKDKDRIPKTEGKNTGRRRGKQNTEGKAYDQSAHQCIRLRLQVGSSFLCPAFAIFSFCTV